MRVDQRIEAGGRTVGYLTIWSETSAVSERMANEGVVSVTAFVLGVLVVMMVFERMLRLLNAPLVELYETVRRIVRTRNYGLRATKVADDEIGDLAVAFNQLMEQIEERSTSGAVPEALPPAAEVPAPPAPTETQPSFRS
jgi:methyl-accepting chemotaxis protein